MSETAEEIKQAVRAAIEQAVHTDLQRLQLGLELQPDKTLIVKGQVDDIGIKRRLAKAAESVVDVQGVVDRTRILPVAIKGDGDLLNGVYGAITGEPAFREHAVAAEDGGPDAARYSGHQDAEGVVEVLVRDGVATLVGNVPSLTHRRLAEVLAWWTPGIVDVDNHLHVVPPEDDSDDEITDAVRIVLEKDPWLDASQIVVHTRASKVILDGLLHSAEQRHMAECDAWYVSGVQDVENRIQVRN